MFENLFKIISDELRQQAINKKISKETYKQFQDRVISTFNAVPITTINNIIASMSKRIRVIQMRK